MPEQRAGTWFHHTMKEDVYIIHREKWWENPWDGTLNNQPHRHPSDI